MPPPRVRGVTWLRHLLTCFYPWSRPSPRSFGSRCLSRARTSAWSCCSSPILPWWGDSWVPSNLRCACTTPCAHCAAPLHNTLCTLLLLCSGGLPRACRGQPDPRACKLYHRQRSHDPLRRQPVLPERCADWRVGESCRALLLAAHAPHWWSAARDTRIAIVTDCISKRRAGARRGVCPSLCARDHAGIAPQRAARLSARSRPAPQHGDRHAYRPRHGPRPCATNPFLHPPTRRALCARSLL